MGGGMATGLLGVKHQTSGPHIPVTPLAHHFTVVRSTALQLPQSAHWENGTVLTSKDHEKEHG